MEQPSTSSTQPSAVDSEECPVTFADMGIDGRILKSIAQLGWKEPTLIQEKGIPLAIHNRKDILARGRTGCGKTGAYLIPILHLILTNKKARSGQITRAVILAPSKELSTQIARHANDLNQFTSNHITILDIGQAVGQEMKLLLAEKPDIIISTPGKLLSHLKSKSIESLKETLEFLVIDEADLMFSFGYESDIQEVLKMIVPTHGVQSFLMSATLNPDVSTLKKLCLKNPVTLKLEESDLPDSSKLTQYHIRCEEEEKYVLINALFKLKLIRGRTIIFTNDVDKCYRLKLFLEQFGIKTCILNPELPVASRCHVVDLFNQGKYQTIIASDEKTAADATNRSKKQGKSNRNRDKEFGVARGIDFQFVSNVINFDFPQSVTSYIHRVGRTGRGDREGTALSFVKVEDNKRFDKVKTALSTGNPEEDEHLFKPYQFKMEELEGIRYRSRDALRAVTSVAVKEARLKEIKRELLTSEKLQSFFEEHPKDLQVLRSDRELHTVPLQSHLKHLPDYIIPPTLKSLVQGGSGRGSKEVQLSVVPHNVKRKRRKQGGGGKVSGGGKNNPLKTFSVSGNKRKK